MSSTASSPKRLDDEILRVLVRFFRSGESVTLKGGVLRLAADLEYLRIQWAISTPVEDLARHLLENRHEAQASFEPVLREGSSVVRGRLLPARTILRRRRMGDSTQVSYLEPRKSFTEGPNHVLGWVLRFCHHILQRHVQLLSDSPEYDLRVRRIFRLLTAGMQLKGIGDAISGTNLRTRPSVNSVTQAGVSRKRLYRKAYSAYHMLTRTEAGDTKVVVELLNGSLIGPLEDWQKFELLLAFKLSECLARSLNHELVLHPIQKGVPRPIASFGPFDTYWQSRSPYQQFITPEPSEVLVHQILQSYGVQVGQDRPDVVICNRELSQVVAVAEAKHTASPHGEWADLFREATHQLVRYSRFYSHHSPQGELLRRSVIAVSNLPTEVSHRPPPGTSPVAVSLADLLDSKLDAWVTRVRNSPSSGLPSSLPADS